MRDYIGRCLDSSQKPVAPSASCHRWKSVFGRLDLPSVGYIRVMEHMSTQSEVLAALEAEGFTENLSIDATGRIASSDVQWEAADVVVDRIARFEGMSNPDDEAILVAITGPDGRKGTLTMPYGPEASGNQADTIRALSIASRDVAEPPATEA